MTIRRHTLPIVAGLLLFVSACNKSENTATDKRWTLPLEEISITTDQLAGHIVDSTVKIWRYDDSDRVVFRSTSMQNARFIDSISYGTDGRSQIMVSTFETDDQGEPQRLRVETHYADSAWKKMLRILASSDDGDRQGYEETKFTYSYDTLGRTLQQNAICNDKIVFSQHYTYADKHQQCKKTEYWDDSVATVHLIETDYADSECLKPLKLRTEIHSTWMDKPSISIETYHYDRYGRQNGRELRTEGDEFRTVYSDYVYKAKKLTYLITQYRGETPIRVTRTEISYKY